jgi:hypothetical protein
MPGALNGLIVRLLSKEPAGRLANAEQVEDAVRELHTWATMPPSPQSVASGREIVTVLESGEEPPL